MKILQEWFEDARQNNVRIFHFEENDFLIYKGFKITKNYDGYRLQDVRRSDFYDEIKSKDLKILLKLGFIEGIDYIVNQRNLRRVNIYTKILEKLYTHRKEYQSKLRPRITREFYQKKIRNCNENIHNNIDLLFLYKSRVEQYNLKYNINEEIKN